MLARPLLGLALGALTAACFTPPGGAVLFSCDRDTAPECPDGYRCQADGCCHKDGANVDDNVGACRGLEGGTGAGTAATGIPTSGSASSDSGTAGDTGAEATTRGDSGGDTGTDTGTTGSSA